MHGARCKFKLRPLVVGPAGDTRKTRLDEHLRERAPTPMRLSWRAGRQMLERNSWGAGEPRDDDLGLSARALE